MADAIMRGAECDLKRLRTSDEGWIRPGAGSDGKLTYGSGCGAGRAYIGLSDDGSIGNGDEGSILPVYKIAEGSD